MEFDPAVNTLFLDCDGVLANFDKTAQNILGMPSRQFENLYGSEAFWKKLGEVEDFYFTLELMPDALELYNAVKHLDPVILTGSPSQLGQKAHYDKVRWAAKHFGPNQKIITCQSKKKSAYAIPGDVIVDDWARHRAKWEAVGGMWVPHVNAADSIRQLKEIGVL